MAWLLGPTPPTLFPVSLSLAESDLNHTGLLVVVQIAVTLLALAVLSGWISYLGYPHIPLPYTFKFLLKFSVFEIFADHLIHKVSLCSILHPLILLHFSSYHLSLCDIPLFIFCIPPLIYDCMQRDTSVYLVY